MTTYVQADETVLALVAMAMGQYHQRLQAIGLTYNVLMAHAPEGDDGEPDGPALKQHGAPALALIKINSLKHRAHGLADVEIVLDGDQWPEFSRAKRLAILDHELTHIEPTMKFDDLGRPKLTMRQHDFQVGWFFDVAQRHGGESVEVEQFKTATYEFAQLNLFEAA